MVTSKAERRRYRRVKVELPIKITYAQSEINALTENISNLGTCVRVKDEIPLNSSVRVVLNIPAFARMKLFTRHIECEGTVIRCEPLKDGTGPDGGYNLGIFFTNFFQEGTKRLSAYLDYLLSKERRKGEKWVKKRKARK